MSIPFYRPARLPIATYFELFQTIRKGWLTSGFQNNRLKKLFAEYFQNENFLLVNSATSGLKLALHISGIKTGDEVILPINTFIATFEVIIQSGAKPILADIDPETWTISIEHLSQLITSKTKAIIPVNIAGNAPNMKKIHKIAKKHNITIIYDNAHGLGDGAQSIADITVFSFYATKNITTGEGGGMLFQNSKDYKNAEPLILHGMDKKSWNRYHESAKWKYDIKNVGFKYNLSDINAVLALSQIKNYENNLKKRNELFKIYRNYLNQYSWIQFQKENIDFRNVHHLLPIWLEKKSQKEKLIQLLEKENIGYSYHFIPICEFSFVKKNYSFNCNDYPNMKRYYNHVLSLPFYPDMKLRDIKKITEIFKQIG